MTAAVRFSRAVANDPTRGPDGVCSRSPKRPGIAFGAIGGGATVVLGAWLTWLSLYAGLQAYRGVDVLNGRLLGAGGVLSVLAGMCFLRHRGVELRWGIGLLGFALLALAGWSVLQLHVIYRALSADPLLVARLGPGAIVAMLGALMIFATLFLGGE